LERVMNLQRADNEWRYDPVDEAWTLVARNRRLLRPREMAPDPHETRVREGRTCPLCQNDVQHLGEYVIEHRHVHVGGYVAEREHAHDDAPPPDARHLPVPVVAVVSPTPLLFIEDRPPDDTHFSSTGALGAHEILAPVGPEFHRLPPSRWGADMCGALFALFASRHYDLSRDHRLQSVSFIALPPGAARLAHAHAALIGTPFLPRPALPADQCPIKADLENAREHGRLLLDEDGLCVWAPYAPRSSIHLRVAVDQTKLPPEPADVLRYGRLIARVLAATDKALGAARATFALRDVALRPTGGRVAPLLADIEAPLDADAALASALGRRVSSLPPEDLVELLAPALVEVAERPPATARRLSDPPEAAESAAGPNQESVR
jgi:hypothetical protein